MARPSINTHIRLNDEHFLPKGCLLEGGAWGTAVDFAKMKLEDELSPRELIAAHQGRGDNHNRWLLREASCIGCTAKCQWVLTKDYRPATAAAV